MSKMSCRGKDHNYRTNLILSYTNEISTEFGRNALLTLEN